VTAINPNTPHNTPETVSSTRTKPPIAKVTFLPICAGTLEADLRDNSMTLLLLSCEIAAD